MGCGEPELHELEVPSVALLPTALPDFWQADDGCDYCCTGRLLRGPGPCTDLALARDLPN